MDESCPICRVIVGKRPGSGKKCKSCLKTQGVSDAYDWYKIANSIVITNGLYMYGFIPLMFLIALTRFLSPIGYTITSFLNDLVPCGIWALNVFWVFPKLKIARKQVKTVFQNAKDKLIIARLAGETIEGRQI